jgi:hypothetical protein
LLLWAGVLLTAAVAGLLVIQFACRQTVTVENYQQVHAGLRLSDVEALLGPPTGDREAALSYLFMCSATGKLKEDYESHKGFDPAFVWHERGQSIVVGFTPSGTVSFKLYYPGEPESLLSLFGRRLRL